MRHFIMAALGLSLIAGASVAEETAELTNETQKRSGLVAKGVQDALAGGQPAMPREEIGQVLRELRDQAAAEMRQRREEMGRRNLTQGKAFLAENAKREGVKELPSGLQYQVLAEGKGASPKSTDTVTVHYRGTLVDGTEFDSSYARNKPATFRVEGVIPGWTEALQLMQEGARWKVFIPPMLAYGERGAGRIGPNSTLVFEVELISIERAD
jgi:FKBP-type peptidyl-prolyl cis-trans isomerase FklB